jgi:hypothetical protein
MNAEAIRPLFPSELLEAPIRERVEFFRSRFVAHDRLTQVAEDVKRAILCPADCAILFVVGPTGVGKSTCRRLVQKLLRTELRTELERDRSRLPYLAVEAPESGAQFNWSDFDKRLLITAEEPFVDSKTSYRGDVLVHRPDDRIEVRARVMRGDLRLCVEEVLRNRRPAALMVDEAAHIFNVAGGQAYRKQLDALKSLANLGETVIVLVGAYDLLSTLGPQLTRRRELVHFERYRWEVARERDEFLTVLGNFQWSLPLPTVPDLMAHAEFLYYASSGCIGVLHGWLTKALVTACHRRLATITAKLLEETIDMADALVMATAIRQGERDLNGKVTVKDLRDALGAGETAHVASEATPARERRGLKPGRRRRHRDEMGEDDLAV